MSKVGNWLVIPYLAGALYAQEVPVPPPLPDSPPDTPVPGPSFLPGTAATLQPTIPKELNIENQGGTIEGDPTTGIRFGGPVKITGDNGLEAFSDRATLDLTTKSVTLNGHVTVYQGNQMQRGDTAVYFYEKRFLDTRNLRASSDPLLLEAGKFTMERVGNRDIFVGTDAGVTTHDVEDPNYWLRAKTTRIYPGEKVTFKNLTVYAGDIPVFWLPYLSQPLDAELGYHFLPGARSHWGLFWLNTYGIMLGGETDPETGENHDAWLLSRWRLNLYGRRGAATGLDLVDTRLVNRAEFSGLSMEYLNDLAPDISRSGAPREVIDENRYRLQLRHRKTFLTEPNADWRLDTNLTLLSDRHYLEDFDLPRYSRDPIPDETLGLYRRTDDSLLSLYARFRVNDFYRGDTRLPEIAYDRTRAPFCGFPVLHQGSTSLAWIGERTPDKLNSAVVAPLMELTTADAATLPLLTQLNGYERRLAETLVSLPIGDPRREAIRTQLLDSSYTRFNTYQEWSLPMMFGGFLSIIPEAGAGFSNYSSVEGPVENSSRTTLHVGTEASVKFTKDLGNYRNHDLGVDGLIHVFQPYGNWSVISTDDVNAGDPCVDRLTPSTRPRPLDPLHFTAVDELQSWNVLRMGVRNRLITRRDNGNFEWLFINTYLDGFIEDPEGKRDFSNLHNDARWSPLPWLSVGVQAQAPVVLDGSGYNEYGTYVTCQPTQNTQITLGYRWLNGHPVLPDSNRMDMTTYMRLSENWGVGTTHVMEMEDGTVESQQYSLHRDLGNWIAAVGINTRDNRFDKEYALIFSITLKDFPSASLPFEMNAQ